MRDGPHVQGGLGGARLVLIVVVVGLEGDPLLDLVHSQDAAQDVSEGPLQYFLFGDGPQTLAAPACRVGVEVLVSLFDPTELFPDETGEGGADDAPVDVVLADGADVEVDVVHGVIGVLELLPVGFVDLARPLGPAGDGSEAAGLSVAVVPGKAVVAATLDVQRQEIFSKILSETEKKWLITILFYCILQLQEESAVNVQKAACNFNSNTDATFLQVNGIFSTIWICNSVNVNVYLLILLK